MPKVRIPLVGVHNQRSIDAQTAITAAQDQQFLNCTFDVVTNPVTGKSVIYCSKRPGWGVESTVASGNVSSGLIRSDSIGTIISAFGTTSTIYDATTSVGTITGQALYFYETALSGVGYILIKSSNGTGWFYVEGSKDTLTYTADGNNSTTITAIKIAGVNSTAGLYPGQKLTAASNIVAGTRIVSVNSVAFTAVLDTATTGGAFSALSITKEPIAKLNDADFVTTATSVSGFVDMDGYVFYADDTGIYNSDLNTVTSYSASAKIPTNMSPDETRALARHKNVIICFKANSTEFFVNGGNSSGSILSRNELPYSRIGCQAQRSVTSLGDDIYFASSSRLGDTRIYRMRDLRTQEISTPAIDKMLGTASASGANVFMSGFYLGGYRYVSAVVTTAGSSSSSSYLLLENGGHILQENSDKILLSIDVTTTQAFKRMLIYNENINLWSEWDTTLLTFVTSVGSSTTSSIISASPVSTGGKIYRINPSADGELYRDDGTSYSLSIRTTGIDHGSGLRKFIKSIEWVGDRSNGTLTVEANDNDYAAASWYTLGTIDLSNPKPIYRCGSYKNKRAYRLTHSDNYPVRGEALDIDYELAE